MSSKTLNNIKSLEKEKWSVPKRVQDIIPAKKVWKDGIFQLTERDNGFNEFSIVYKFNDVNFELADEDGKEDMLMDYGSVINTFDSNARYKITLLKRKVNKERIKEQLMLKTAGDSNDNIRKEYNDIILSKAISANGVILEYYLTITCFKKNYEAARAFFQNQKSIINVAFKKLDTALLDVDAGERLRLLRDFYRDDIDENVDFNFNTIRNNSNSFKDIISPETFDSDKHSPNHFKLGDKYGRALYLKTFGNFIKPDIVTSLCSTNQTLAFSIDFVAIPTDEAVKAAEDAKMRVESNKMKYFQKAAQRKQYGAELTYDMKQQLADVDEWLSDLLERDQRMFCVTVTMVHLADSLEQLDADTDEILAAARSKRCQMGKLLFQQLDGLNTALPYGVNKIYATRTLTTDGVCSLNPFRAHEVEHQGGLYFGTNAITGNIIAVNTDMLLNPNIFIPGIPGSGKSMFAKFLMLFLGLGTDHDIIVLDPENEFSEIVKKLNGDVVELSVGSGNYLNVLDITKDVSNASILQSAIADKTQFMLSILEQMDKTHPLTATDNSIINRTLIELYSEYDNPTMIDLKKKLETMPESAAKRLALRIELFTTGSFDTFAHHTTVTTNNRIISYNLNGLNSMEKKVGMVAVTEAITQRIYENFRQGKQTYIFADEFQVMLEDPYTRKYFCQGWKRWRKRGGIPVGITQNINYMLDEPETRDMLGNSPLVVMFKMAETDIPQIAELYSLTTEELKYISSTTAPGNGLMKVGSEFIPFENQIPNDTEIYKMLTTKVSEGFTTT